MWFVVRVTDPPAALTANGQGEGMMEEEQRVWEYVRGTAGLLLSGLKSLGAPARKQSQFCF